MRRKRLWIINQYAGSKLHGVHNRSFYIGEALSKINYDVSIIAAAYTHLLTRLPDISNTYNYEKIENIDYCWVKVSKYKSSKSFMRIISMFVFAYRLIFLKEKNIGKPDAILVSSPSPFPIIIAYFFAKKYNANLVFEVRDIWPLTFTELGGLSRYNPFVFITQLVEDFAYKNSKYVASLLPNAIEHMKAHGLNASKFRYVPNGISLSEMQDLESLDKNVANQLASDKFIIGYVGAVGVANALEYLVDAAKLLECYKDIVVVIVGKGVEKNKLVLLAKQKNIENVLFLDAIPKTQVQSMLSNFDVCYIGAKNSPLYKYGVSANKIFDYMYAEKPILSSILSGKGPIEESGCGVVTKSENAQSIADGIIKLYRLSENERKNMGKIGKEFLLKTHTYECLAGKYIEFFN